MVVRTASRISRFRADRRGVSAVEFALILPVLLLIYMGGVEMSLALSVDRKVNQVSSTLGDLVAQSTCVPEAEFSNIFAATRSIMEPNPDTVRLVLSVVAFDEDGNGEVAASRALNTAAHAAGSPPPMTIPADISQSGTSIVLAEAAYDYATPFSGFMANVTGRNTYTFTHDYFLRPRGSNIQFGGC